MDPCVVVATTCESICAEQIVKGILQTEELSSATIIGDGFRSYPWHIDTKYYEADVKICTMDKKNIGSQEFAESVNAVIVCFDSNCESKLQPVNQWLAFTKEFAAEVKILVCDSCCNEDGLNDRVSKNRISKVEAQQWCVSNGFELVELNPDQSDLDSDTEDDFPESLGMSRVIQALHAHLWPNLKLKASHNPMLPPHSGLQDIVNGCMLDIKGSEPDDSESNQSNDDSVKVAMVKPLQLAEYLERTGLESSTDVTNVLSHIDTSTDLRREVVNDPLNEAREIPREVGIVTPYDASSPNTMPAASKGLPASVLSETEPTAVTTTSTANRDNRIDAMLEAIDSMPEDNFEQLFNHLSAMKTKASNLSPTHRKAYAEKMAVAFWNSIGGDPSEVNFSSDEES